MDTLYLLQFTCFLFMLVNILILGITRLHMKWMNRRYEVSRWLIIGAMVGLAIQFLMQMLLGFRAQDAAVGAVCNILVYPPCFSLISIGIYNIEATHANRRNMNIVCASIFVAILAAFCIGYMQSGNFHVGSWIYVMIVLFGINIAYCIYMIIVEIRKRRRMLEVMAGYKKYVLGVSFPHEGDTFFVGMRHHCGGNATPCFKEKHYICTMKSITDSFA